MSLHNAITMRKWRWTAEGQIKYCVSNLVICAVQAGIGPRIAPQDGSKVVKARLGHRQFQLPFWTTLFSNIFLHDNTNMLLHSKRPDVQSQAGGGPPAQPPGPYQGHPGWGPQGPGAPGQPQPGYRYK
ncbi:hypothetical protein ACJ73_02115 [Blastomyces percursus]|uniref:Uncharacterized protein n=1 Tax=Blastomyces percursus TaxID=1658174 RepID=A0A1J9RD53_9EURO|nr:hypothetical protein ACJ73_02115 [Blastomyces percursus]